MIRESIVKRKTNEVEVYIKINIDGEGKYKIDTGIPFFNHMLEQLAKHGLFDIEISAKGDTEVDFHHTVEDVGIALGEAFNKALGDKKGINRYGFSSIPFDETLSSSSLDLSGRPFFIFKVEMPSTKVGEFDVELAREFFQSFTNNLKANIHIETKYGTNNHHIIESIFKSIAKSLDVASAYDSRSNSIPSTKGNL
ncbi:MAG: imidazoleglycerol-phosphate dehydratase HisB [Thermodesulfobacteriota bacterium]|jgi:imidazoleglycerol-phosphate dehydratase|nr:imidazoleglycerol-phosphate dehydratase HisB [Candidatus Dadabacteria bacterium]|tara:strand:- start:7917 stop:8504 length:588 start_codon:yes stop_codon:yes gene_type:complete